MDIIETQARLIQQQAEIIESQNTHIELLKSMIVEYKEMDRLNTENVAMLKELLARKEDK
jgi:predicted P-loop ATPase